MAYLLNCLYLLLLILASPYLLYQALRKHKYREGFAEKFLGRVPPRSGGGTCLWFHAVSVGEVNLLAPLLKEIALREPGWECVISTTTMTGMATARKKYPQQRVFYCPLDFSWAVRAAMRRIRPDVLVLAELELWPNLIRAARQQGAKVAVINGRLSEHSFAGYRRIQWFVGRLLRQIDLLAVQDAVYAERFRTLGAVAERVHLTGSMKYDGAQTNRDNPHTQRLRALAGLGPEQVVWLAGSTQEPEEEVVLEVFRRLAPRWPQLRLILVPRHPERFEAVGRLLDRSGLRWQRRSQLDASSGTNWSALLIDAMGELGAWWGAANIAFVGGSLGNRGGQNMIEPAGYGAAIAFGPNTWNFRDIVATMLARQAAVVVADGRELERFVDRCLQQPDFAAQLGRQARELVFQQLGATQRTLEELRKVVQAGGSK